MRPSQAPTGPSVSAYPRDRDSGVSIVRRPRTRNVVWIDDGNRTRILSLGSGQFRACERETKSS